MPPVANLKPKYTQIFIDNEFRAAKSGKTFHTINPATEAVIADIAVSTLYSFLIKFQFAGGRRGRHRSSSGGGASRLRAEGRLAADGPVGPWRTVAQIVHADRARCGDIGGNEGNARWK